MEYCWAITEPERPEPMMQLSYCLAKMSSLSNLDMVFLRRELEFGD